MLYLTNFEYECNKTVKYSALREYTQQFGSAVGTFGWVQRVLICLPQVFRSLVDRIGLGSLVPVEYFGNKNHEFLSDRKPLQRFEVRIFGLKFMLNICDSRFFFIPLLVT